MLSPIAAPSAAMRPSGTSAHMSPADAITAAAATSTVSLGIGGKKPSMIVTAKSTAYSQGDATVCMMSSLITSTPEG